MSGRSEASRELPADPCPIVSAFTGGELRRCCLRAGHYGRCVRCWRCGGRGFTRKACQVCGLWRSASGELAYMDSLWGDAAPVARAKPKRKGGGW